MADVGRLVLTGIGYYFGGPIGGMIGSAIGSALFPAPPIKVEGPRLTDLKSQTSQAGAAIPIVYGTNRLTGNVIASSYKIETKHTESQGGKGGGPSTETTTYTYSIHAAIAVCQGPAYVTRIWANKKLIYSTTNKDISTIAASKIGMADSVRFYSGTETQGPDSLLEILTGSDCAYRGTCYVVFQNLQLEDFGNELPQFEFEVCSAATFENWALGTDFISTSLNTIYRTPQIYQVDSSGVYYSMTDTYTSGASTLHKTYLVYYNFSTNKHSVINNTIINFDAPERFYGDNSGNRMSKNPGIFVLYKNYDESGNLFGATNRQVHVINAQSGNLMGSQAYIYFNYEINSIDNSIYIYQSNARTYSSKYFCYLTNNVFINTNGTPYSGTPKNYKFFINGAKKVDYTDYFDLNNIIKDDQDINIYVYNDELFICTRNTSGKIVFVIYDILSNTFSHINTDIDINSPNLGGTPCLQKIDGQYIVCKGISNGRIILINRETYTIEKFIKLNQAKSDILESDVTNLPGNIGTLIYNDGIIVADGSSGGSNDFHINRDKANYNIVNTRDIVNDLLERTGLDSSEYDTSEMNGQCIGYKIGSSMSVRDAIEPIQKIEPFDAKESNGKLVFNTRTNNPIATIYVSDLAVNAGDEALVENYSLNQVPIDEVPVELNVKYFNIDKDHETDNETVRREQRPLRSQKNSTDVEVPFVLKKASGQRIARQQLYDAWSFKDSYEISVSRKYEKLEPGDIISVETDTGLISMRITEKENNGYNIIKLKAQKTSTVLNRIEDESDVDNNFDGANLAVVGPTNFRFLDLPPLTDSVNNPGFYCAAEGFGSNKWSGCNVYKSQDGGLTYSNYKSINKKSNIGYAINALNQWNGQDVIDVINYVDVYSDAELSSITEETMLSSKTVNMALIGDEIIQYQNAELIDTNTYRLSNLRRNLKQTSSTNHSANEDFIQLDFNVQIFNQDISEHNIEKLYNVVSFGKTLTDSINKNFTNTNNIIKPLSPIFQIGRYTDGLHFNMTRQFRSNEQLRDLVDIPEDDSGIFTWYVDVYSGATFKRTLSTTTTDAYTASITYTSANMTTDFTGGLNTVLPITLVYYVQNARGIQSKKVTEIYQFQSNPYFVDELTYKNYVATLSPTVFNIRTTKYNGNGNFITTNTYIDDIYLKNDNSTLAGTFYDGSDAITAQVAGCIVFKQVKNTDGRIFQLATTSAGADDNIRLRYISGSVFFEIGKSSTLPNSTNPVSVNITSNIKTNDNDVNVVIFSITGTQLILYVNNVKITTSTTKNITGNIRALAIGASTAEDSLATVSLPIDYIDTRIHSFFTLNRVITDAEASNVYNNLIK